MSTVLPVREPYFSPRHLAKIIPTLLYRRRNEVPSPPLDKYAPVWAAGWRDLAAGRTGLL
jgi:hypothetical protein